MEIARAKKASIAIDRGRWYHVMAEPRGNGVGRCGGEVHRELIHYTPKCSHSSTAHVNAMPAGVCRNDVVSASETRGHCLLIVGLGRLEPLDHLQDPVGVGQDGRLTPLIQ